MWEVVVKIWHDIEIVRDYCKAIGGTVTSIYGGVGMIDKIFGTKYKIEIDAVIKHSSLRLRDYVRNKYGLGRTRRQGNA